MCQLLDQMLFQRQGACREDRCRHVVALVDDLEAALAEEARWRQVAHLACLVLVQVEEVRQELP